MTTAPPMDDRPAQALMETVLDLAALPANAIPADSLQMARFSLYDWLACGLAGVDEPVAQHLRALAQIEGGTTAASIFGAGKAPARMAALVNGATSHALDYDDTHFAHIGHLSVGIYPAALAAAEDRNASIAQLCQAFLLGAEAAIRIGMVLGSVHYNRGFHQTATAGAFGATVAAGRLMGLDRAQMRAALGLCATRASGVKSQFGTMGKPYNAGLSAANGVECATLAALGMGSADDGLMGLQGFIPTHSDAPGDSVAPPNRFLFDDIKYKFHACCHGTHAMIESLLDGAPNVRPDQVRAFVLRTNPRWLRVCDNPAPRTGLEVKFSYRWLAGMVLHGQPTGLDRLYTDELAHDPGLTQFAKRVTVIADDSLTDMQASADLHLIDGQVIPLYHDLDARPPLPQLERKLRAKVAALLGDRATALNVVLNETGPHSAADLGGLVRVG